MQTVQPFTNSKILHMAENDKAENEELSIFFNLSFNPCCILSREGSFKKVNPAFVQLSGYTEEELLDTPFIHFIHPLEVRPTVAVLSALRGSFSTKEFENRYRKKNGQYVTIAWSALTKEEKGLVYVAARDIAALRTDKDGPAYLEDVTQRRRNEEKLNEINQRFDLVLKATSEAIWDWKIGTDRAYCYGENFKKIFGYDIVDNYAPYRFWENNLHPEGSEEIIAGFWKAINSEATFCTQSYWFKKANGEYAYVKGRVHIVRDGKGTAVRILGVMDDVTAQKRAEEALAESEKSYKHLFDNAPLPQFIFDIHTFRFLTVNDAMAKEYGYSREELLQMSTIDIRPQEDIEKFRHYIHQHKECKGPFSGIWTHIKKSGERMTVEVASTKIIYQKKQAILVTINNLTEKIKFEEKVSRLKVLGQKKITQAAIRGQEQEREALGKELHDNINQVVTTTKLYLEVAEAQESMRMDLIRRSKNNLITIINEIRFLSKSLIPPALKDIGLTEAVQDLIESFLVTKKFKIHFNRKGAVEALQDDIKITLFRVIQEQLNNIMKYAEAKNVWVDLSVDDEVTLSIRDDGKGFDPLAKRKGVGITNIKNRAELYNGTLQIDSYPQQGCTLLLKLPLAESISSKLHVLIAEDSMDDQEFLSMAFSEVAPQHKLTFTTNGEKLVNLLNGISDEELPSLIVLDYNMPVLNGLETLKRLEVDQRFRSIPKIVYSTSGHSYYKELCYSANATAYIEKGFSLVEIKENIRQMLSFCN